MPPVILPVASINPPVPKLPTLALPVTDSTPPVLILAAVIFPVKFPVLPESAKLTVKLFTITLPVKSPAFE